MPAVNFNGACVVEPAPRCSRAVGDVMPAPIRPLADTVTCVVAPLLSCTRRMSLAAKEARTSVLPPRPALAPPPPLPVAR